MPFQEGDDLVEDVVECHGFLTYQTCSTGVNCLRPHGYAPAAMLLSTCTMYPNRMWCIVIRAGIDKVTALWIGFQALQGLCHSVQRICDNDDFPAQDAKHLPGIGRVEMTPCIAVDLTSQLAGLFPFFCECAYGTLLPLYPGHAAVLVLLTALTQAGMYSDLN